jgi:glycosyltransferase involved in cell wall biosynthesis
MTAVASRASPSKELPDATSSFLAGDGVPGLVSVIVPTYNRAAYVADAVASALAQTYSSLEVVVIDDGSVDDTRRIVGTFEDPRLIYVYKDNGGLSSARNAGLARANGEFIAFLDSDDLWLPWKLEAQLALLRRHPDVGLVWTDTSTFRTPGEILHRRYLRMGYGAYRKVDITEQCVRAGTVGQLSSAVPIDLRDDPYWIGDVCDAMFFGNLVHPPTALVRRSRLRESGPYESDVTGDGGDDYHFFYRVCERGPVALLDAPTILYRLHGAQIVSSRSLQESMADLRIVTHWLSRRPPRLSRRAISRRLASAHRWVGQEQLAVRQTAEARKHLWRSLALDPLSVATMRALLVSHLPSRTVGLLRGLSRQWRMLVSHPS